MAKTRFLNFSPSDHSSSITNGEGARVEILEDLRGKQVVQSELISLSEVISPNNSRNPLPKTYLICSKQDGLLGGVQTLWSQSQGSAT